MADQRVKNKLKRLLDKSVYGSVIDAGMRFEENLHLTLQLGALKTSTAQVVDVAQAGGEGTPLYACDIQHSVNKKFLGVYGVLANLYVRHGYDELYEDIKKLWKRGGGTDAVVVKGNAGTGKSWYQAYVLRRLLKSRTINASQLTAGGDVGHHHAYADDDDYDFVFRQIANDMYLIDIKDCKGYKVTKWDADAISQLTRCLYFFEPGPDKELAPTDFQLPSLSTLSPYEKRLAEYTKSSYMEVYFWPWSFTEILAVINHSKRVTSMDALCEAFYLFGGIIRHHLELPEAVQLTKTRLDTRLRDLDLSTLQSKVTNIDRDTTGNNVSGYILCYDGKRAALESKAKGGQFVYFNTMILRYTSAYVEEKAQELLDKLPLREKMKVVFDRLNDRVVDLSGKNLEAVACEFLSAGTVAWFTKRAGGGDWRTFKTKKRKVTKEYDIAGLLTKADQLLVPTNTSFPVADIVFSNWGNDPALVFQCTWQSSHPFTVRALYELRVKHLRVDASKLVIIIMVSPDQETTYANRAERDFLQGSIDGRLRYTESQIIEVDELQSMWTNTQVHILRPEREWKDLVGSWLDKSTE